MSGGFTYTGTAACGCIQAAVIDNPDRASEVRVAISEMVRDRLRVERRPTDELRTNPRFLSRCPGCDPTCTTIPGQMVLE